jgi:aldehyde dehydrogenase
MATGLLEQVQKKVGLKAKYDNWIGGKAVPPVEGKYFDNISPLTGKVYCQAARSDAKDVEKALDAAHQGWERFGGAFQGATL